MVGGSKEFNYAHFVVVVVVVVVVVWVGGVAKERPVVVVYSHRVRQY